MGNRKSGILLHITSLPGREGIGTLGKEAFRFINFLIETNQKIWQILPLGPAGCGNSPYQSYSAFAGNPLLIDIELLVEEGWLDKEILEQIPRFKKRSVDFKKVENWKYAVLKKAFYIFHKNEFEKYREEYHAFIDRHAWWLNDYVFFMAAKTHFGKTVIWNEWPDDLKYRNVEEFEGFGDGFNEEIEFGKFLQFLFFRQWFGLKKYANEKGVQIMGDIPLYVSEDSSDVWTNPDIFILNEELKPVEVGGVPPDYFSSEGQLWGNPVFNWARLKERKYDWWMARLHFNLNMFDQVRIDHFRGLESYWSVPATEKNAMKGKWISANGLEMLELFKSQIGTLPLIAEDLGVITPDVDRLRKHFDLPGMKVLQFAFLSDAANKDLPHNYNQNYVAYTGTHDNDTTLGWLNSLKDKEKACLKKYSKESGLLALKELIEMTLSSVAEMAIIPMQDILELDSNHRMNTPGTASGNWSWRFQWIQLKMGQKKFLREATLKYNR